MDDPKGPLAYVLVCLAEDTAAQEAAAMAEAFKAGHPAHLHLAPFPTHDEVRSALETRDALVTAHNGGNPATLRSKSQGGIWADEAAFASTFQGARVYVYACETMGKDGVPSLSSFGRTVCEGGVRVFVGHCCAVTAGGSDLPASWEVSPEDEQKHAEKNARFQGVVHAIWRAFLEGEDDEDRLRTQGLLASDSSLEDGLFGMMAQDSKLSDVLNALCVARKP